MISMIVCMGEGNVIGTDGEMPWKLPEDMKHFRKVTEGGTVLMGRKTYDSIGMPLKGRKNIVLTRKGSYYRDGVQFSNNLEKILAQEVNNDLIVIGGSEIYEMLIDRADKLYVTRILADFEGDTYFPDMGTEWEKHSIEKGKKDIQNPYDYYFIEYTKEREQ